jgi:hypothetical protein
LGGLPRNSFYLATEAHGRHGKKDQGKEKSKTFCHRRTRKNTEEKPMTLPRRMVLSVFFRVLLWQKNWVLLFRAIRVFPWLKN